MRLVNKKHYIIAIIIVFGTVFFSLAYVSELKFTPPPTPANETTVHINHTTINVSIIANA